MLPDATVDEGTWSASRVAGEGIDVGGAVWVFPLGVGRGVLGTFSGGIVVSELGELGGEEEEEAVSGEAEVIGPGAGGVGPFEVWL